MKIDIDLKCLCLSMLSVECVEEVAIMPGPSIIIVCVTSIQIF